VTRLGLIKHALGQRCKADDDWNFSALYIPVLEMEFEIPGKARLWRWLYTLKAVICIALDRQRASLYGSIDPYTVQVANWGWTSWSSMDFMGTAYDFSALVVAHGLRHWFYHSYRDSTV
jgi:hypothetical protein